MAFSYTGVSAPRVRVSQQTIPLIVIAILAVAAATGAIMLAGTKTGIALALLAVLGPICGYLALTQPLVMPFGLFLLLVPFDNLLALSTFGTLTKLIAIASGAMLLLWMLRTRRVVIPDRSIKWWGAFALWVVCSMLWAVDPKVGLARLETLFELMALFGAVSLMPVDRRQLGWIVTTIIAGGVLASLYGAYVFRSGTDVSKDGRLFLANQSTIIDPNHFAAALILPLCLALMSAVSVRGWIPRGALLLALLALGGGIAVASSRGSFLAIVVAFVYLLIRSRKRLAIGAVAVCGFGVAIALYSNVLMRFSNAISTGGAGREDIWRVGVAAFKLSPIVGFGFGNFQYAFDRAYTLVSQHYYTHWHRDAHDIFLSTAVELGVIGLALLVTVIWKQIRSLRLIQPENSLYSLRLAIEAGAIGVLTASIFLDTTTMKYFWLVFILTALTRNAAISEGVPVEANVSPVLQTRPD